LGSVPAQQPPQPIGGWLFKPWNACAKPRMALPAKQSSQFWEWPVAKALSKSQNPHFTVLHLFGQCSNFGFRFESYAHTFLTADGSEHVARAIVPEIQSSNRPLHAFGHYYR
jgi:hypothetical protein